MGEPLVGIRVIDISRLEIGAAAAQYLGDLGADVVRVEGITGEPLRQYAPRMGTDSPFFLAVGRNSRSICVDFNSAEGREIVLDLVRSADVFIQVSRPGAMKKLGLDYKSLSDVNPRLVYCSISPYGETGPYAQYANHSGDIDYFAGLVTTEIDEYGRCSTIDLRNISGMHGGYSAVIGVLATLLKAKATGEGSHVEVGMWDSAVTWDMIRATMSVNDAASSFPPGLGSPTTPKHAPYLTSDGRIVHISPVEFRFWTNFCRAIGRPDLEKSHDLESESDFGESRPELYDEIASVMRTRTAAEWVALFGSESVPFSVAVTRREALTSEQAEAHGIVWNIQDSAGEEFRVVGRSVVIDGERGSVQIHPPSPGQHTEVVLGELGYDFARIAKLRDLKVIK